MSEAKVQFQFSEHNKLTKEQCEARGLPFVCVPMSEAKEAAERLEEIAESYADYFAQHSTDFDGDMQQLIQSLWPSRKTLPPAGEKQNVRNP